MKRLVISVLIVCLLFLSACNSHDYNNQESEDDVTFEYGVFIGADPDDVKYLDRYKTIVIDGQLFSREQINQLKSSGHIVYSYINVGALENYRDYYSDYEKYTLDVYENWEDERWVDVSSPEWKDFIINDLAAELYEKGIDGLFVDNLDVYYHYKSEENYEAITEILQAFKSYGLYVVINGGDVYVTECIERYDSLDDIFDAVNQETVFSSIIWDEDRFGTQESAERKYFQEYLERVKRSGRDVYLLEYTTDEKVIKDIKDYCSEKGYKYYISSTLGLEVEK